MSTSNKKSFKDFNIGVGNTSFLIAEVGVNHNGSLETAFKLIDAAVESGANAVKFQTFLTEENISKNTPLATHHLENVGKSISHYDLIKQLELPLESFLELKNYCNEKNIIFISTPYDLISAEYLISIKTKMIKIASSEMLNFPLLNLIGRSKIPLILSTGMSDWDEISSSVYFLKNYHNEICILKCTSNYPSNPEDINLLGLVKIRETFPDLLIGFSDHSEGSEVSLASLGIGINMIERHFTLDKNTWGPDHKASMTPNEFKKFVKKIRKVEKALGSYNWDIQDSEIIQKETMRKGVYSRKNMKKGQYIKVEDVKFLRPLGKMTPKDFFLNYLNRPLCADILAESEIASENFS